MPNLDNVMKNQFGIGKEVFEEADIIVGFFSDIDTDDLIVRPADEGVISSIVIHDVLTGVTTHAAVNASHVTERLEQLDERRAAADLRHLTVAQVNSIAAYVNSLVEDTFPRTVAVRPGVNVVPLA